MAKVAPFGSWRSPITAEAVATAGVTLTEPMASAGAVYWLEGRPAEGGRQVLVGRSAEGTTDAIPRPLNARTTVHEYGGGSYFLHEATLFFSNFHDQGLYRVDRGGKPRPITPEPPIPAGFRYADGVVTGDGRWIVCVREQHHRETEAENDLVLIPADGSADPVTIASGRTFYSYPRLSPDGSRILWTCWDHPNMPWDGTELWAAEFSEGGLRNSREVAGGPDESIYGPSWSPGGEIYFASDRTGWWNIYRETGGAIEPVCPMDAEFGGPQWRFRYAHHAFLEDGRLVSLITKQGVDHLAVIEDGAAVEIETPYTYFSSWVAALGNSVVLVAGSPTEPSSVIRVEIDSGDVEVLATSTEEEIDDGYVSKAEPIEFPTQNRLSAHALYYPPKNKEFEGPVDERPPLIVFTHGGPTGHVNSSRDLIKQFWTSRGFAVVDVNYGGSTGYGREYRNRLRGMWGVVDTEDCISAARYLIERGDVDGKRVAIRGGSAGGWTTLSALAFHDFFQAGANYFGVAELETFVRDTHKFESRYLDSLIGPYPERKDLYEERSPANFAERISCPLITFQGLEDKVVPPSQSEIIVNALREKGLPVAYLAFEGEQHGFRQAPNIRRAAEAELYFYGRVFGIDIADEVEPVTIENL